MDSDPSTEELRAVQAQREQEEAETAEHAVLPEAQHAAERRSDKAGYLKDKLAEQQAADDDREPRQ